MNPQSPVYARLSALLVLCGPLAACLQSTTYTNADIGGSSMVVAPENVPADGITRATVRVVTRKSNGVPLSGLQVALQVDNGSIDQPQNLTDANGLTEASLTAAVPGEHTISGKLLLSGGSVALNANTLINAYAPAAAGTAEVPVGTLLNLIVVADPSGMGGAYRGTVHFSATDPDATLPADYTYTAADHGLHLFRGLMFGSGGTQSVSVTDVATGAVLRVARFDIAAAADQVASQLAIIAPSRASAGTANRVLVLARDTFGNSTASFTGTVHWSSSDPNAQLPADAAFTAADRGQHTFEDVTFFGAGSQSITVSATGVAAATATVTVDPGLPRYLGFVTPPGTASACSPITPAVRVQEYDAYGNPTANFGDTVALTLQGPETAAVLQGNTQVRTIGGVATFGNLAVSNAGGNYVLSASIGYENTPSPLFDVGPDAPRVLSVGPVPVGSGDIAVPYVVSDACGTPVDLNVSFDGNQSGTFTHASAAPSDANYKGVTRVPTSSAGVSGTFLWNSLGDVGHQNLSSARVRISAAVQGVTGAAVTSAPFAVQNGPVLSSHTDLAAATAQTCVALADLDRDARLDMLACATGANAVVAYHGDGNGQMTVAQSVGVAAPVSVAAARLNGDANIDFVVAQNANAVAVALAQPDGAFAITSNVTLPAAPVQIALADVNRDGKRDIVTANADGSISIAPGVGDGTFGPVASQVLGTRFSALAIEDLNHDGALDLVVADAGAAAVLVCNGSATTSFAVSATYALGNQDLPVALALADLNHDGSTDIVAAFAGDANVGVFAGNAGSFAGPVRYGVGGQPSGVAVADFDGDGTTDVAVSCAAAGVMILPGTGSGTLAAPVAFTTGAGPRAIAVGDINRDNEPDIVTANTTGLSLSLLSNAQRKPHNAHWRIPVIAKFQINGNFSTGNLGVGDLNGDGKADVALTLPNQPGMGIMLGDGAGNLSQGYVVNIQTPGPHGLALVDVNRDGYLDMLTPSDASNVLILSIGPVTFGNNLTARFASTQLLGVENSPSHVAAGDLNGDGWPDIAVANAQSNDISIIVNINGTSFMPEVGVPCGAQPAWAVLADVDSDGALDLVVAESGQATVGIYHNDGLANFSHVASLATDNNPHYLTVGDIDGDTLADIAVATVANKVDVFAGLGNGNFVPQSTAVCKGVPLAVGLLPTAAARPSLVVLNDNGPWQLQILPNTGSFTWGTAQLAVTDYSPLYLALADLNSDGFADVLTSSSTNTVALAVTDNAGNLQLTSPNGSSPDYYNGGVNARSALADLDRDGRLDIVEMNLNAVGVKRGSAGAAFGNFTQAFALAGSGAPRSLWTADVNHDGSIDAVATTPAGTFVSLNDGAGNLQAAVSYGPNATVSVPVDYNHDGNIDIITGALNSTLALLVGNGNGTFSPSTAWSTAASPTYLSTGDLDMDGNADIVATVNGSLQPYLRSGSDYLAHGAGLSPGCVAGDSALADVNRDGTLDLVSNCVSGGGTIAVFIGSGGGNFGPAATYLSPGAPATRLQVIDLTLDGVPDILYPLSGGKGIGTWVGNGDGTFQIVRYLGADVFPADASVADFNRDGLLDIFIVGQDYAVAVGMP